MKFVRNKDKLEINETLLYYDKEHLYEYYLKLTNLKLAIILQRI